MRFCLQAVFFSLVFNVGPGVAAQDLSRGSSTVEGLISRTGAFGVAGVEVQLVSERDMVVHRAFPDRGGTFRFDGIPTGRYELRVNNLGGDLLHRELLAVRGQTTHVAVELPGPPASAPPGTVSIAELQRKVSPRAQKEFRRAEQAIEKGKLEEAVARLRKALATDSHYVDAHVNLGACLARLKRHEEAAEQFAIAVGWTRTPLRRAHVEGVLFDELPPAFDVFAHQRGEDLLASTASSRRTRSRVRVSAFMVVSHSCSAFISPSPL
jgi:tetratricopeptide (TPR) repeat protein